MPIELLEQPLDPTLNPEANVGQSIAARTVMDEQGYERRIYDLAPNLSVSFRGREELPTISNEDLGEGRPSFLLTPDETPRQVELQEFQSYVESHSGSDPENEHLIANATPLGVVDLAMRLRDKNTPDPQLEELRSHFLSGAIGQRENALLDMMSAAVFTEENPNEGVERTDGLLDVAQALAGDKTKQTELVEKMKTLESQEEHLVAKEIGEDTLDLVFEHEPVEPEAIEHAKGLILVRTTDNKPGIAEDGTVFMQPAAELSKDIHGITEDNKAYVPRYTTHFSLNHHVQSHIMGNFEDQGYTVISPLDKALEANGRPAVLYGVDTYFTSGPGEKVMLPSACILEDGKDQAEVVVTQGNIKRFKSSGFKPENIDQIVQAFGENGAFRAINQKSYWRPQNIILEAGRKAKIITEDGNFRNLNDNLDGGYEDRAVIKESDISRLDVGDMLATIAREQPRAFEGFMATLIEDALVTSTILEQGGQVVLPAGTSNFVQTPGFDGQVKELADELHVRVGLHQSMIERDVEKAAIKRLLGNNIRKDGRYNWENPNNSEGEKLNEYLNGANCPQRLRRAALEAGLLTVRGGEEERQYQNSRVELIARGIDPDQQVP